MGISLYMPGRATRRKLAGGRCCMCNLGVTANDLALASFDGEERLIHQPCTSLLIEMLTGGGDDDSTERVEGEDHDG